MYWVYILYSTTTGKYYIGSTKNLTERLHRHNTGRNVSTRSGRPWRFVYQEQHHDVHVAHERERQIKS